MGEVLKFKTWCKHRNVFHKITSDAFVFDIKGIKNAAIGFAKKPGDECELWILIGYRDRCWIKKNCDKYTSVHKPRILNENKYRKFWIRHHKSEINFGVYNVPTPILTFENHERNLYYVTFTVLGEGNFIKWKCYLSPEIYNQPLLKITGGEPHWVKMTKTDKIPNNALIGGHDKDILYIIRAQHEGSLMPGKLVSNQGSAYLAMGGLVFEKDTFEVLCGYNFTWMKIRKNQIPLGAVPGGYYNGNHDVVYIGRGYHGTAIIPGKIHPSRDICYVPYKENEVTCHTYEILVSPHMNTQSFQDCYYTGLDLKDNYMFNKCDILNDSDGGSAACSIRNT